LDHRPFFRSCYLGGGTALALQLGHRRSHDLDFFHDRDTSVSPSEFSEMQVHVLRDDDSQKTLMLDGIKVDFIAEMIPLQHPLLALDPALIHIKMADIFDIGRMKLLVVGSRGSKKDFVDLFCLTRNALPLRNLLETTIAIARGIRYSKMLFLKALIDFEAAESDADPDMLWEVTWQEVKENLTSEIMEIAKQLSEKNSS